MQGYEEEETNTWEEHRALITSDLKSLKQWRGDHEKENKEDMKEITIALSKLEKAVAVSMRSMAIYVTLAAGILGFVGSLLAAKYGGK